MGETAKYMFAAIVVVIIAGIAESYWPNSAAWFVLMVLLGVALAKGNFGSELTAISAMLRGS